MTTKNETLEAVIRAVEKATQECGRDDCENCRLVSWARDKCFSPVVSVDLFIKALREEMAE